MKKLSLLLSFVLVAALTSHSQIPLYQPCHFEEGLQERYRSAAENMIGGRLATLAERSGERRGGNQLRTIPVVVHVIHNGGNENISQSQIESQIEVLNEDFGKYPGTNGDGAGVDTKVRFCLARIDPDGDCTNGVVRIQSHLANHQTYQRNLLTELSVWDPARYLNIYVVASINGNVGGYASFPGGPPSEDGIVIRHNLFGRLGTATGLGRTCTHEVGHWLGLYHTFQNGCGSDPCLDGDLVCDTPPVSQANFNCPSNSNSCSNDVPDLDDQVENYMDYTNDACQNMYTNGQSLRMEASLDTIRTLIWSLANLAATGCDSAYVPPTSCPVKADFVALNTQICEGIDVDFSDRSLNGPTSWNWSFPGGVPSTSNVQNPTVNYASTGTYDVELIVSDSAGADTLLLPGYITVSPPGVGDSLPYAEDFDLGIYPPTGMSINNLDGGVTWELDTMASVSGDYSIKINNLINTNYGSADELALPPLNLASAHPDSHVVMRFKWAYAKSDPLYSDELLVLLSTDCGVSFGQIFYRTQNALTTGPTQTTPFVPSPSQWREAQINLNPYRNDSFVQIKIVNVTDGGNNLYIEDIFIGELFNQLLEAGEGMEMESRVRVIPQPNGGQGALEFDLPVAGRVEARVFDGQGKVVGEWTMGEGRVGRNRMRMEAMGLAPGLYRIEVRSGEWMENGSWLIQR